MASLSIFGPADAGNPSPPPADPTVVHLLSLDSAKKDEPKDIPPADKPTRQDVLQSGSDVHLRSNKQVMDDEAGPFNVTKP